MITRGGGAGRLGVVVLAGGRGERFGDDKLAADLGGHSLLDHTLDALPEHATVVCVGPTRPTSREVTWAREDPPFTGPLAALVAGVRALPEDVRAVALVGADMPGAGRIIPSLTYALAAATAAGGSTKDPAAAVSVSVDGHRQPLLAVWWRTRLEQRLAAIGDPADRAVRLLLDDIDLVELTVPATAVADVDTAADLAAARDRLAAEAPPPRPHEEPADG